ncbi:MAG: dihydrodipicolinate synthase family protein [Rhodospirillales bacterium]|jgi:4-hydroxy-tetrahydrodipicolinate synthase|nr:dihydrodipicolinate synthase family protein [Rhodospirillales bacterium]
MTRNRIDETAAGCFPICPTPFMEDGALDIKSLDRLIDFFLECGVKGMVALGVFGEAAKLSPEEGIQVLQRVLSRIDGRVPTVLGTGNLGLRDLSSIAKTGMDAGAAGVMISPASGLRTDEQVYNYTVRQMEALGEDVPVVFQDYPPANNVYLSVPLILKIFEDFPHVVVFKAEDNPGLGKIARIRRESEEKGIRRVSILGGTGGFFAPATLRRGADGLATGFSYPENLVQIVELSQRGDFDRAEDLFDVHLPLICHEQQPGLGICVRKFIMYRRGLLRTPVARQPVPALDHADLGEIDAMIKRAEDKMRALGMAQTASKMWIDEA